MRTVGAGRVNLFYPLALIVLVSLSRRVIAISPISPTPGSLPQNETIPECDEDSVEVYITLETASFPSPYSTKWEILKSGEVVKENRPWEDQNFTLFEDRVCLPSSECYMFLIEGTFNGAGTNQVVINGTVYNDDLKASLYYDYDDDEYYNSYDDYYGSPYLHLKANIEFGSCYTSEPIPIPLALTTPSPTSMPVAQPTFVPSNRPSESPSILPKPSEIPSQKPTIPECDESTIDAYIEVKTADYPRMSSWEIRKSNGELLRKNQPWDDMIYTAFNDRVCVHPSDCYGFIIEGTFSGIDQNQVVINGTVFNETELKVTSYYDYDDDFFDGTDDYYDTTHVHLESYIQFGSCETSKTSKRTECEHDEDCFGVER